MVSDEQYVEYVQCSTSESIDSAGFRSMAADIVLPVRPLYRPDLFDALSSQASTSGGTFPCFDVESRLPGHSEYLDAKIMNSAQWSL